MAQEVRIIRWCDNTTKHGEDQDVPADALPPISIGKDKPRDLDLCAECRLELYEPLSLLLEKEGRATDTGRRKNRKPRRPASSEVAEQDKPFTCADCGRSFGNERGLIVHRSVKHHGEPTLLDQTDVHRCPDCGQEFEGQRASQKLGAHRARKHGYRTGDDNA